jgi:hypothetical protein
MSAISDADGPAVCTKHHKDVIWLWVSTPDRCASKFSVADASNHLRFSWISWQSLPYIHN